MYKGSEQLLPTALTSSTTASLSLPQVQDASQLKSFLAMKFATASLVTLLAVVLAAGSVQASRCVKNCVNIDGHTEAECLWMCVNQDW